MIRKQDILDRAGEWSLRPEVVEKDYVLGWLLTALATVGGARGWVFKGGTCIKKCYFETYRFSEDLDFSLLPEARYTPEAILEALRLIAGAANEMSGIEFPEALIEVRSRRNQQGQATFEGRIPYLGPLAYPGYPRVRVDITQNEQVFDAVTERRVFHPYPDELSGAAAVAAYSFDGPAVVPAEMRLAHVPIRADERRVASTGMRFWGRGLPLETIRFAGANRLLVEFEHDGIRRVIEPYVLAETATGNIRLYGWEQASSRIEMFEVTMIERLRIPGNSFSPRYRVDLSSLVP